MFREPRLHLGSESVQITAAPQRLKSLLAAGAFAADLSLVWIQNRHASAGMYWHIGDQPASAAVMHKVPTDGIQPLPAAADQLDNLWVCGDGDQRISVTQWG